jgi:hypothetical protein
MELHYQAATVNLFLRGSLVPLIKRIGNCTVLSCLRIRRSWRERYWGRDICRRRFGRTICARLVRCYYDSGRFGARLRPRAVAVQYFEMAKTGRDLLRRGSECSFLGVPSLRLFLVRSGFTTTSFPLLALVPP